MPAPPELALVIFDCDGVLVDSERLAVRIDRVVLADLGWDLTEDEIVERFVGRSDADMTAAIEAQLGRPLPDGWDDRYRHVYLEAIDNELEPVAGVVDVLDALDARGVATCVASSGTHEKMRRTLGKVGLYERFAGRIFSAIDVTNGKPAPDLFLHAAAAMHADPAACAVVEDSRYGVEAALAAGMRVFAYGGGVTSAAALARSGAVVFDDMRDLTSLLLGTQAT